MSEFCVGGLWPAIQAFIVFVVTNICTHAASVLLPSGADMKFTAASIFVALFMPAHLGDHAFHMLGRWWRRLSSSLKREMSWKSKIVTAIKCSVGGNSLRDAVMTGAVAIYVPPEYARGLHNRWDRVMDFQKMVISEKDKCFTTLSGYDKNRRTCAVVPQARFGTPTSFYLLPPTTRFKENVSNKGYILTPTSNFLTQAIAIFQLIVGARQLYINYNTSIATLGLASPYLVVIPYVLMTLLNFAANALVGSYPQIMILPNSRIPATDYDLRVSQETEQKSIEDFKVWFKEHYDEEIEGIDHQEDLFREAPRIYPYLSTIFCVGLQTFIIGLLTHFRLGIPSHAAWFLLWVYFPAIMRHLPTGKILRSCSRQIPICSIPTLLILTYPLGIGWFGGVTVLEVELMEAMCQASWTLSVGVWVLVGSMSFLGMICAYLIILLVIFLLGKPYKY